MCGIVGFAGFSSPGLLERMTASIFHRGPDDEGLALEHAPPFAIGMRRLAIIDVVHGRQPMASSDGKVRLVYNGEIYNHGDLRDELRALGHDFHTSSDTEVVLAAYLAWGDHAWARLRGMFAVAIMDLRHAPKLMVVRDRHGMKPLYYAVKDGKLAFASEMKALLLWDGIGRDVDLASVHNYLALRYVPGPRTLLADIRKLPAGHMLVWQDGQAALRRWAEPLPALVAPTDPAEAVEWFRAAMADSVRRHMVADVPLGLFLSGGIDSCAIAALMAASGGALHAFTISFPGFSDDETAQARSVANHLGARHSVVECLPEHFNNLPDIMRTLDEPIGDPIVVPTYELARAAARDVKVVLSGVGGDEVLGGYLFQRKLKRWGMLKRALPQAAWPVAGKLIAMAPEPLLDRLFDYPGRLGHAGRAKIARFVASFGTAGMGADLRTLTSQFDWPDIVDVGTPALLAARPDIPLLDGEPQGEGNVLSHLTGFMAQDWLPDLMLTQFDKLTMAHSLEGRVPFVDDGIVQAALALPDGLKLNGAVNKWVLRKAAEPLLPPEMAGSRKKPFYLPFETYLKEPRVKAMFRDVLDPERLRRRGLFRPEQVAGLLDSSSATGFLGPKRAFAIAALEWWFDAFAPDASFR